MTNRDAACEGFTNRKPSSRYFSELFALSREVRPLHFHIAHWTAQHPVGKDDILGNYLVSKMTAVDATAVGITAETI